MDEIELGKQLERLIISSQNTERMLAKVIVESESLDSRIIKIEQQLEVNSHHQKGFWERDWNNMMGEIRAINKKLEEQLSYQAQNRSEVELMKQRLEFLCKVYDEKLNKLEKVSESNQLALWKLAGIGAGSGAIITTLIEIVSALVK